MKPSRGHPARRRSALKYFILSAPLIILAYVLSRKESSALSDVLQSDAVQSATAPLVTLLQDEGDGSLHPSDFANEQIAEAALREQISGGAAAWDDPGIDALEIGDQDAAELELHGGGGEYEDEDDAPAARQAWDDEEQVDGADGDADGDDDDDATDGAAFSGEGLDAGDEDEEAEPGVQAGDGGSGGAFAFGGGGGGGAPPPPNHLVDMVFGKEQDEDVKEVLGWMAQCTTLNCIIKAHDRLQGRTRFNFPHFFLVGWQKCATTSVNAYLRFHPQYLPGVKKEPHWFSVCQSNLAAPHCLVKNESQYLREFLRLEEAVASRLELVTLDASADYAGKGGPLARRLYRLFPWLKVVIMIREPISRLISYTRMHTQSTFQQWKACRPGSSLFMCLKPHLAAGAVNSNYSDALMGWLTTFPTDQVHVIQFEELQETPEKVLYDLKTFLGMDVALPDRTIANVNSRREGGGYPMGRGQYLRLVRMVKQDAERTAEMLHRYGLADKHAWMARWHAVWNGFLQRCPTFEEQCMIDSN